MSLTVTHPFVSLVADSGNTSLVQPSNWNDDHTVVGDATATTGYVLVGQGAGAAPIWSSSFPSIITFPDGTAAAPSIRFTSEATGLFLQAAGSLGFSILGVEELRLTASALSPGTSDGNALGTTSLMWSDLFLASGGVINWNAGDVTLTHSADTLTLSGDTLSSLQFAISGTTVSTSTGTGALVVSGGAGFALDLYARSVCGTGSTGNAASKASLDYSGGARLITWGNNASTNATFSLITIRSDGSNALTGLTMTATGRITIPINQAATGTTDGSLVVTGGVGVSGAVFAGTTVSAGGSVLFGSNGTYAAGCIYSDTNWGMIIRAKQTSPGQADFSIHDAADAELFRGASGNFGVGNFNTAGPATPSYLLSLQGQSARTIGMERHQTAATAGNDLTIIAGGAKSGSTDKNGGNLILQSGTATGTGSSDIVLSPVTAGSTGTTDRTPTEVIRVQGLGWLKFATSNFQANGAGTVTITNVAPAGVATATITKWLRIDDGSGVDSYIPVWQ